jgi:hypothetical protein
VFAVGADAADCRLHVMFLCDGAIPDASEGGARLADGCAMVAAALAVGLNGILDGSPPVEVPVTVVNNGPRLATLRVVSGDGSVATFDIGAHIGTYREGQTLMATLHAGTFHPRWCERVH